jgi:hypothetical protein
VPVRPDHRAATDVNGLEYLYDNLATLPIEASSVLVRLDGMYPICGIPKFCSSRLVPCARSLTRGAAA